MEISSINPSNFPGKLWCLLNDPHVPSIWWDASGESILVHQERFEAEVLFTKTDQMKKYFKTTQFISFVRQLNLYGFSKVRLDHYSSEKELNCFSTTAQLHQFRNPNFKRDKPELLVNLKRLTPGNKAKLAARRQLTSQPSNHFHHVIWNSTEENSAGMKKGSVSVEHQGSPYHHHSIGPQQMKECDRMPRYSQAAVRDLGDPSRETLYTQKAALVPVLPHFWAGPPYAHPFGPMHVQQGLMPHHTQYMLYTPVSQYINPGFLDSAVQRSQQPAASYCHYGPNPDDSVSHLQPTEKDPDCKADPFLTSVDMDALIKIVEEMEDDSVNHLHPDEQNPDWKANNFSKSEECDTSLDMANWWL